MTRSSSSLAVLNRRPPLRIGFLPVNDCAPLAAAQELGYFGKYALEVELKRLKSWTEIRDHLTDGLLDAAQAPVTLPLTMSLGVNAEICDCTSSLVMSLNGNAVTVSTELWKKGLHQQLELSRESVHRFARLSFAVPCFGSTQHFVLRRWIQSCGLNPEEDVRIVAVPPTQLFPILKLGYVDGFCAPEPWNSVAVQSGTGVCVATGSQLLPMHPETVLMTRASFAAERTQDYERLIAALIEAGEFCDRPWNRKSVAEMISAAKYVDAPPDCISRGIAGPLSTIDGRGNHPLGLNVFNRFQANEPSPARIDWITTQMSLCPPPGFQLVRRHLNSFARTIYVRKSFTRAVRLVELHARAPVRSKARKSAETQRSIAA